MTRAFVLLAVLLLAPEVAANAPPPLPPFRPDPAPNPQPAPQPPPTDEVPVTPRSGGMKRNGPFRSCGSGAGTGLAAIGVSWAMLWLGTRLTSRVRDTKRNG